jgi:hypothetical protein
LAAGLAVFWLIPILNAAAAVLPPNAGELTWTVVFPHLRPPPLEYASEVYDSDNGTVVLFGGKETNGDLSNTTWVWAHSNWTAYPASEIQAPPPRQMASMAFDPQLHKLILFGGQGPGGQLLDDTWAWNGASWYQLSAGPGNIPSPREAAGLAYDRNGSLVLFGGTGYQSTAGGSSTAGPAAGGSTTGGPAPGGSTGSSAAPGGSTGTSDTAGGSSGNTSTTTLPGVASTTSGTSAAGTSSSVGVTAADIGLSPAASAGRNVKVTSRAHRSTAVSGSRVTGGAKLSADQATRGETSRRGTATWERLRAATDPASTSTDVRAAAAASTPGPFVGQPVGPDPALAPPGATSGTSTTTTGAGSAGPVGPGTPPPTELAAVAATPDGIAATPDGIAATLDGNAATPDGNSPPTTIPTTTSGPNQSPPLVALGDTWLWTSGGWVEVSPGQQTVPKHSKPTSPPARSGPAMSYDSTTGDVLLFSGESTPAGVGSAHLLSDTWLWNGSSWAQVKPKTEPPARFGSASTDDSNLGGVLLLGGAAGTGSPIGGSWAWTDGTWSELTTGGSLPALQGLAAAFSSATGEVLAFGGAGNGGAVVGNTFLLGPAQSASSGSGSQAGSSISTAPGTQSGSHSAASTTIPPSSTITSTPTGAAAGSTPSTAPLTIDLSVVRAGGRLVLSGGGFLPETKVSITFHSRSELLATVKANAAGRFVASVAVPHKAGRGTHQLMASGLNAAGRLAELIASIRVVGGSGSSGPSGAETGIMVGVALGIPVVAWLSMSGYGRFRRRTRRPAGRAA